MRSAVARTGLIFALCSSGSAAVAASSWNLKLSAERTQQSFETETEQGDASINTVTLAPSYTIGNWQFSMTLPWQFIDGRYFFNNVYPNVVYTCNQINALTRLQKFSLIRNTSLTLEQVRYCAQTGGVETQTVQESVSGWNDIELFVNYLIPYGPDWFVGSIGVGYQDDNADVEQGLGNGTKQSFVETTWFANQAMANLSMTLGYNIIVDNNSGVARDDNGYAVLDGRLHLVTGVEVGVAYHYQQSSSEYFDDYDYLMYSLYCSIGQHWSGQFYFTDYSDGAEFPEQELGLYLSWAI